MALVKKDGSPYWYIEINVPAALIPKVGKKRIRESTGTADKLLAQELHDKRKAELWRQDKLGEQPKVTLAEAVERWKKRALTRRLRNREGVAFQLDWWVDRLGAATPVDEITRQQILAAVEGKMTVPKNAKEKPRPASQATVNRYLQAMRGLLRLCAGEWELIKAAPTISLHKETARRPRTLSREERKALFQELPPHLRDPFLFSLVTGLRQANAVLLKWEQVDLVRRRLLVEAEDFKNGEDFGLPLSDAALAILERNAGRHHAAVFTFNGTPLGAIQHRTWAKALARAGIKGFRWHDLRHTWATSLLEAGVDLDELQQLGGWKSRDMVLRYAHYRTEHLRGSASKIDKVLGDLV